MSGNSRFSSITEDASATSEDGIDDINISKNGLAKKKHQKLENVIFQKEIVQSSCMNLTIYALQYLSTTGNIQPSFDEIIKLLDEHCPTLKVKSRDSQRERILLGIAEGVCEKKIKNVSGFGEDANFELCEDLIVTTDSDVLKNNIKSKQNNRKRMLSDEVDDTNYETKTSFNSSITRSSKRKKPELKKQLENEKYSESDSEKTYTEKRQSKPKKSRQRAIKKSLDVIPLSDDSSNEMLLNVKENISNNKTSKNYDKNDEDGEISENSKPCNDDNVLLTENQGNIIHGKPKSPEEILPLALIYQSEPKIANFKDIHRYLERRYGISFKKEIDNGIAKLLKKSDITRTSYGSDNYELTVSEFSPDNDGNIRGKIINAIVATHKPCIASKEEIKDYIKSFHSDVLGDTDMEEVWKKGIEKDLIEVTDDDKIKLAYNFEPTPEMLRGEDTENANFYFEI